MMRRKLRSLPSSPRLALSLVLGLIVAAALAIPVLANLGGSDFDAGDGNLVLNDEATDWVNAPNFQKSLDKPTGATDDSFGQGTKEDTEVPSVVDGSIPNNKSDLTRFYFGSEHANGKDFMYFAWERVQDPNGTTNMDIELNQSSAVTANGVTPVRTAGDVLFKYDLSQGGTNPQLGYHRWITTGSKSNCEAANALPCWDKVKPLSGNFEASINGSASVVDPIAPGAPRTLGIRTFGEAGVNLTDSGIIPSGTCVGFGSAYIKSRSSDSFTAAVKDFIAPLNVNISNCQPVTIKLKKTDPNGTPLDGAVMQLFKDNPNGGTAGVLDNTDTQVGSDCNTTDNDPAVPNPDGIGSCVFNLAASATSNGTYIGHEKTPPPGYTTSAPDVNQVVTVDGTAHTFTLTFSDSPADGKIVIAKQDDAGNPLGGAEFTLYKDDAAPFGPPDGNGTNEDSHGALDSVTALKCTTAAANDPDNPGACTIDNVPIGKYWVVETVTPANYDTAGDQYADVQLGGQAGQGQTLNFTFIDPRLHRIIVLVCHQGTDSLVGAKVKLNGADEKTTNTTNANATALCGVTSGAVYSNRDHTGNTDDALSVSIPGAADGSHP